MSVEIKKDITTVTVEVPKTGVAVENAVTNINVQVSQPQLTISQAGVSGRDGTSGTSGTFGNVLSSSLRISGSIIPNVADGDLTSSFSLGSSTNAWKDLWISKGTIYFIGDNNQTASISINAENQIEISDINLTGSLTASLKEGYIWVGGPDNISVLIATSSLVTGGTGAGFPFEGNADITGSLNVSGSIFLNGVNITSGGGVGTNGSSGTSATSGTAGSSGSSGLEGSSGTSGINGEDGNDGDPGTSGTDGSSGSSGTSANDGTSGVDGTSGTSATDGSGGTSGIDGTSGLDGTSGTSATDGSGGTSGVNGSDGTSGSGGSSGVDGSSGTAGSGGTSGVRGERYKTSSTGSFTLGNSGTLTVDTGLGYTTAQEIIIANSLSNYQISQITSYNTNTGEMIFGSPVSTIGSGTFSSWVVNLSGASGGDGTSGTSGDAGTSGVDGTSGSSGLTGSDGTSGSTGSSGTSATAGSGGSSGSSGTKGSAGTSGSTGSAGTSGSSGSSGVNGSSGSSGTAGSSGSTLILTQYNGSVSVTGSLTVSDAFINDATLLLGNSSSLTLTSGSDLYINDNGNLYLTGSLLMTGSITLNGVTYTSLSGGTGGGSGTSGVDGSFGTSGTSGTSSTSGTSGLTITGSNGSSGTSGISVLVDSGSLLTTASFNEYSSSLNLRIVALEYSSSLTISGSNGTSGIDGTSGTSGLTITGSAGTSGIDGTSGTAGSGGSSGTSGFSIDSGSLATTGSNTFLGNEIFSGSITLKTPLPANGIFPDATYIHNNPITWEGGHTGFGKWRNYVNAAEHGWTLVYNTELDPYTTYPPTYSVRDSTNAQLSSCAQMRFDVAEGSSLINFWAVEFAPGQDGGAATQPDWAWGPAMYFYQGGQGRGLNVSSTIGGALRIYSSCGRESAIFLESDGTCNPKIWAQRVETITGNYKLQSLGPFNWNYVAGNQDGITRISIEHATGKTEISGSLHISSSLTASLREGYTWVGGAGSVSKLVATSSFSNGVIADTTELNNFTGSIRAEIDGIESYTASLKATTLISGAAQITALGFGAGGGDVTALNTYTSSNDFVLQRVMQTTASLNIVTGSFVRIWQTTASLNTFTGSIRGEVNGLEAYTASLKSATLISSSTQITNFGIYATLTANSFNGNQTITGSLTVSSTAISEATLFASASNLVLNSGSNLQINNSGLATINNRLQVSGSTILSGSTNLTGSVTINESRIDNGWTAYTPEWTANSSNPAINNGTIEGYYKVVGKTCFVRGNIAMGSTTTFGSGEWYISMPFTASHADGILMSATLLDNGSAWYNATVNGARAGFNHKAAIQYQHNSNGTAVEINPTQPFTWTNGDRFIWNGSYEIA